MDNELDQQELEQAILAAEHAVEVGEKFQSIVSTEAFQTIFQEKFIDAFAITNTMNFASATEPERARIVQKIHARGVFSDFCQSIINDHRQGIEALKELKRIEA